MAVSYHDISEIKQLDVGVFTNSDPQKQSAIFVPGWGQSKTLFKTTADIFAPLFTQTYVFSFTKGQSKVLALLDLINIVDDELIVIAQSEGAIYAVEAALVNEKVKKIILINPSGLVKRSHPTAAFAAVRQFLKDVSSSISSTEFRRKHSLRIKSLRKYLATHRFDALTKASRAIRTLIHDDLKQLQKRGVEVHIFAAKQDLLFPHTKITDEIPQLVESFTVTEGWHDDLHYIPEKYLVAIQELL